MRARLWKLVQPYNWIREIAVFGSIYFFLSLINLRDKILLTPSWFDGTLRHNHLLLLQFNYTNNEQSRLLQFLVPEFFRWLFSLNIRDAYILQRWLFVFLAFVCFHLYLRKWFNTAVSFAGVVFLAAIMSLTFQDDLQESSPLLLLTFVTGLWAIREKNTLAIIAVTLIGALNNETVLVLPLVYLFYHWKSWRIRDLAILVRDTVLVSLPAVLTLVAIRYINRDRPHLGGAWHWPDNIEGIFNPANLDFLHLYAASYWYLFIIFGAFWILALIGFRRQPLFLRQAGLMVPFFVGAHLVTGIVSEVRQMLPLGAIVIPMGLYYLFPPGSGADDQGAHFKLGAGCHSEPFDTLRVNSAKNLSTQHEGSFVASPLGSAGSSTFDSAQDAPQDDTVAPKNEMRP